MSNITSSATLQFDYQWRPVQQVEKSKIPHLLWPWLVTQASLTTKLQRMGELSVQVIEDSWGSPTPKERRRLGLGPRTAARIRTVLLKVNGSGVIYARSVIPARSLIAHWRQVKYLKNTPLGGYLFRHKMLKRSNIEIAQLPNTLFPNQKSRLWARRSVFHQFGPGILVSEVFFEEIYQLKQPFGLT